MKTSAPIEPGHDPVRLLPLELCRPSPENDRLYRPIDPADPDVRGLAQSIARLGVIEPLVVTLDGWILSGHRRRAAAVLAGLTMVPCRVDPMRRVEDPDGFLRLLREFNRQREKTSDEMLREAVVETDPTECYRALLDHRQQRGGRRVRPPSPGRRPPASRHQRSQAPVPRRRAGDRRVAAGVLAAVGPSHPLRAAERPAAPPR